jgi:membrane-associated phospholipid phosphatase
MKFSPLPILFATLVAPAAHGQVVAQKDRFSDVVRLGLPVAAAAVGFYKDDTDGLKQLGASLAATAAATELLKRGVDSARPDGTRHGLPSGHVSMAFAAAAYMHQRYSLQWALPMYALATASAYERVHTRNHFTKDVVAGAAVGIVSALAFTGRYTAPRSHASITYSDHTLSVGYATSW